MRKEPFYEITDDLEVVPICEDEKQALDTYYKQLGEKIKKAREEAGYTLARVGEYMGITPSAIANYESGIRQIPVHLLLDFAKFLGKPMNYFLGPESEPPLLIAEAIKNAAQNFSEATYISSFYELRNGKIHNLQGPDPMIPLPQDIAKDHHFALVEFKEKTGTYNYLICKWYKPVYRRAGILFFQKTVKEYVAPDPEDWILAEIEDTEKWELVQFKDMRPSNNWNGTEMDKYLINIRAVVLAKVERLVK